MRLTLAIVYIFFISLLGCKMSTPISPGELATVHAHLEGTGNCTQCHILGKKVSDDLCLKCHTEINDRIIGEKGYHSSKEPGQKKCYNCHSDHHGRNFEIIHFDTLKFDHALTGYPLEGKHTEKTCRQCHNPKHIQDKDLKSRTNTFLGLSDKCLTCHDDFHQGTLASNCIECHDFNGFKPVTKFNHDLTRFRLSGQHLNVECEKCHISTVNENIKFQQFTGLKFDNCSSCHKDVHNNKFGEACVSCHSENSFREIKNRDQFNHNLTGYKLEGMHKSINDCYKCHVQNCTSPLEHARCLDCHEDYHKGTFTKGNKVPDCNSCHDINGFKIPKYTIAQHNTSQFPLTGAHEATPCISCHRKSNEWKFRKIVKKCIDCHANIHK